MVKHQLCGVGFLLLLFVALEFVGAPWLLWTLLAAVTIATLVTGGKVQAADLLFLAASGFMLVVFLANQPDSTLPLAAVAGLIAVAAGVPLGLAAFRYLKGTSAPMRTSGVIAGVVVGMVGVLAAIAVFTALGGGSVRVLPSLARIPRVDIFGLRYLFPSDDPTRNLICTATGSHSWQCSGFAQTLGLVYQALQSALAVYWEVVVCGVVVLGLAAIARKGLPAGI